jgi:hypothetical protein
MAGFDSSFVKGCTACVLAPLTLMSSLRFAPPMTRRPGGTRPAGLMTLPWPPTSTTLSFMTAAAEFTALRWTICRPIHEARSDRPHQRPIQAAPLSQTSTRPRPACNCSTLQKGPGSSVLKPSTVPARSSPWVFGAGNTGTQNTLWRRRSIPHRRRPHRPDPSRRPFLCPGCRSVGRYRTADAQFHGRAW